MKYTTTILSFSVHGEEDNPVFGESATHIRIEDEAGGPFIVMTQYHDNTQPGEVRFDFEEIEQIADAIRQLRNQPIIERLLNEGTEDSRV